MLLYVATTPSGRAYVGVTRGSLARRKKAHKRAAANGSSLLVHRALRKHGDAMDWRILAQFDSVDDLFAAERAAIIAHRAHMRDGGLNMTEGGEGYTSPHTEEVRAKMRSRRARQTPPNRKLAPECLPDVMRRRSCGESFAAIGRAYGVTAPCVFYFCKRAGA